ncbi:MAG: hypothetical protein QOK30_774 [Nocardioidaceae bacterium]|jgi:nucleotide-binding universal stress UspA family protein|nr:hypothetical protein [Nocardioidaceae bacterium]
MRNVIAVGVCASSASRVAVRWAMRRAALTGATVVLLHVVDDQSPAPEVSEDPGGRERRSLEARRFLVHEVRFARSVAPGTTVLSQLLWGSVMWELSAASVGADLIVVGTHKTGFIHGTVYGSTSLQLAAAAACPLVVVPTGVTAQPRGVVVGADESPAGRAALAVAVAEAAAAREHLVIVRVWSASESADAGAHDARDEIGRGAASRLLTSFADSARAECPGLTVHVRGIQGASARALVDASPMARLLVLGSSRARGPGRPVLGAVCHDALINIVSPTMIVHVEEGEFSPAHAAAPSSATMRAVG